MAWEKPSPDRPVWCAVGDEKPGLPTAESVKCVTKEPERASTQVASLEMPSIGVHPALTTIDLPRADAPELPKAKYEKFTSQEDLGHFLVQHYKIRTPNELSSCEVCHR
jgi:hypothetical protein